MYNSNSIFVEFFIIFKSLVKNKNSWIIHFIIKLSIIINIIKHKYI